MTKIYHNNRCSKSRSTLDILNQEGEKFEVVEYLKNPPSKKELEGIIKMLGIKPMDLIRKGESIYKETYKNKGLSDSEWIEAMVAYPILIERPIVVKNGKAKIGRPPESVLHIL